MDPPAGDTAGFRLLEHPADLGLEAWGGTLAAAFEQAARGLVAIILDPGTIGENETREISLSARDPDQLLVKWLEEVLYLYDGAGFVPSSVRVEELSETHVRAVLRGDPFDHDRHVTRLDVKAITYHQLSISSSGGRHRIRVYLDI